jgi:5-methylcytosine-specific restriction endonuclease McrA
MGDGTKVAELKITPAERTAAWRKKNPERYLQMCRDYGQQKHIKIRRQQQRDSIRELVIKAYGGCCCHCGYDNPLALAVDHVFNDGCVERKNGIAGGTVFYRKLIRENFPKDRYQLLCYNCNHIKEVHRQHERREKLNG